MEEIKTKIKKISKTQREYHEKFIEKHKDKIIKSVICNICDGSYIYFNKSRHLKTSKHKSCLENAQRLKEIII